MSRGFKRRRRSLVAITVSSRPKVGYGVGLVFVCQEGRSTHIANICIRMEGKLTAHCQIERQPWWVSFSECLVGIVVYSVLQTDLELAGTEVRCRVVGAVAIVLNLKRKGASSTE